MKVVKIKIEHLNAFRVYVDECLSDDLDLYASAVDDYELFLNKRISYSKGLLLPDGWPPMSMFFCIENKVIVGAIRVRHGTNNYINNVIGHIGYETSPKVRGRGVATFMLSWVKNNIIEKVSIVSCDVNNFASQKVIENSGGQYLNTVYSKEELRYIKRYLLKPANVY